VDDNNRVHKGELLAELDKEPFQDAVAVKRAAVDIAEANLRAAKATVRDIEAQALARRWGLQNAVQDVDNEIALLHARVAALDKSKAELTLAQADFYRAQRLLGSPAESRQEFDRAQRTLSTASAQVTESLAEVYRVRASLGLPAQPDGGKGLDQVPPDLDQTFSSVLAAQADLIQSAAQLGVIHSYEQSPKQMLEEFEKQGDIDRTFARLAAEAPAVKQAEAKLEFAKRELSQSELDLGFCDIVAKIDGVVTRRNVNPGDYVQVGQNLMAIRSLREIWVDANFKETQLATYASASLLIYMSTCTAAGTCSRAGFPALRWGPGRRWRCCRRRTRPATSSRWSSGCQSGSISKDMTPTKRLCSSVRPLFPTSTSTSRLPGPMPESFCKAMRLNHRPPARLRARRAQTSDNCGAFTHEVSGCGEPLAGGRRRRCADVHGGARHHDRGGRAALYRRWSVGYCQ
jgi:multidrug resistance efflux pump